MPLFMSQAESFHPTHSRRKGPLAAAARPPWVRYGAACLTVAVALLLILACQPEARLWVSSVTLLSAVVVAAWLGGAGAALLATFLGAACSVLMPQLGVFSETRALSEGTRELFLHLMAGGAISLFARLLASTGRRAEAHALEAHRNEERFRVSIHAERQRLEDLAAASELHLRQLEAVFQSMTEGVAVFSPGGDLLSINPAMMRMHRVTPDQIYGRHLDEILVQFKCRALDGRPVSREEFPLVRALGGETIVAEELRMTPPDTGADLYISYSATPVRDADGQIVMAVMTARDVTRQKQSDAALRESELHYRTLAAQLAAARDKAVEASRIKSLFLANMSHELRTPLTAILGYAEMIEEDAREAGREAELQDLANITSAGRQLLELINSLLDYARVESGRMDLVLEKFSICEVVAESADTAAPLARQNQNELRINCTPDLGMMTSDRIKVRQILINLLSNACKFTERGEIEIWAGREEHDAREWAILRIRDTGIGIPPEHLDSVFGEFVQADPAITRKHGGTGLGLAITRRFAEMLGGSVCVESEPGKGSTFIVHLPIEPLTRPAAPGAAGQ